MKMTFRWFGDEDPVTLDKIRQIPGMTGVVTALYDTPVGEVWSQESIDSLKKEINDKGLEMEVIESVPVHEDIKLGRGDYKRYIENYKENIRRLAKAGVKTICYNFMPVFDWTRSQLDHQLEDGSNALVYYKDDVDKLDPTKLALPGWDSSYTPEEMTQLIQDYKDLGEEGLWKNLEYFIKEVMPVAVENDVNMAIHPDDPPWPIFGIPRIITDEKNLDRFLDLYDDKHHGLTLCSGSLGCTASNDIVELVKKYAGEGRIHFAPVRNVKILGVGSVERHRDDSGRPIGARGGRVDCLTGHQLGAPVHRKYPSRHGPGNRDRSAVFLDGDGEGGVAAGDDRAHGHIVWSRRRRRASRRGGCTTTR